VAILKDPAMNEVDFDPKNMEHVRAMGMLIFARRQHPTLRFRKESVTASSVSFDLLRRFAWEHLPEELKVEFGSPA